MSGTTTYFPGRTTYERMRASQADSVGEDIMGKVAGVVGRAFGLNRNKIFIEISMSLRTNLLLREMLALDK